MIVVDRSSLRLHLIITLALVFIQTTLLRFVDFRGVCPDIVLIYLVFSAHTRGALQGQVIGFLGGVVEDLLSLAPLGFNALTRLITGFFSGKTQGKISLDPLVSPLLLVILATCLKEVLALFILSFFQVPTRPVFALAFWISLGMNTAITPVLYNLFRKLKIFGEDFGGHH